jgi:putative transposase
MPKQVSAADLALTRRIDALHLENPFMGARMLRDRLVGQDKMLAASTWAR